MSIYAPLIGGLRLVANPHLVIGPFEDWSHVRSHGRARRRRRKHRQRIRIYYKPDPNLLQTADGLVFGHPETLADLRRKLEARGLVVGAPGHD